MQRAVLVGVIGLCACSQDAVAPAGQVSDAGADTVAVVDVAAPVDVPAVDLGTDPGPPDTGPTVDLPPVEGAFMSPCDGNGDCDSGLCVTHLGDSVCSKACVDDCPDGWECSQVAGAADLTYACVSTYTHLCRPCSSKEDCKSAFGAEDVCVQYADGAQFCGAPCVDGGCPDGYACDAVSTIDGVVVEQCVATSGLCACSESAVELGLATPCLAQNEFGTCTGQRVCTDQGLSACDAGTPAEEVCNGVDDDCDGVIDQDVCDDGNPCTEDTCDPEAGCTHAPVQAECTDNNVCTLADHCDGGSCVGTVIDCSDGNDCTVDLCDETGGCVYSFNASPCDDGDPCTVADTCGGGTCAGFALACECEIDTDCLALEDGDVCNGTLVCDTGVLPHVCVVDTETIVTCDEVDGPCVEASCHPQTGECGEEPANDGGVCSDGDPCTLGETCAEGQCGGGVSLGCDDGNACTDDSCGAAGCTFVANAEACDDGNACTSGDQCSGGACAGAAAVACTDGIACTQDGCDPATGCTFDDIEGACSDGDPCTVGDACSGGACVGGAPLSCNDGNPCTDDACSPSVGCQFTANSADCDDGNACTPTDGCAGGSCVGAGALECDDGKPCTTHSCDPATGCKQAFNTAPCDDGDLCTTSDVCAGGACKPGAALPCTDGNPCTDDGCAALIGCTFTANSAACDDGNKCTPNDGCVGGACIGTGVVACQSNECQTAACDPAKGCETTPLSGPCDDGDTCTTSDACSDGACKGGGTLQCFDDEPCTDDTCETDQGCVFTDNTLACNDSDPCTVTDVCSVGACVGSGAPTCDDDDKCTTDTCTAGDGCTFTPLASCCGNGVTESGEQCDDGNDVDDDQCSNACAYVGGSPAVKLTGNPDAATVFNTIERTFFYSNNLTNGIWHAPSNKILTGHYSNQGYYSHSANAGGWPQQPNNGVGFHGRMVHMPATNTVVWINAPNSNGMGPATANQLRIGSIDPATGALSAGVVPQMSDGFTGDCSTTSSSATDLFFLQSTSVVRQYSTAANSNVLTFQKTITLNSPLPAKATCSAGNCYGGTFAWDGMYFYFPERQGSPADNKKYWVFNGSGVLQSTYSITGSGGIAGLYFDWSVGRYASHDGYGTRQGGALYTWQGGNHSDDSQSYGPPSPYHSL